MSIVGRSGQCLTGQPSRDGRAPLRLPRAAGRRIHFERRRTLSAAHVGRILRGADDRARPLHMVRHRPIQNASTVGSDRTRPGLNRSSQDIGKQFGRLDRTRGSSRGRRSDRRPDDQIGLIRIQPSIKQACDNADLPRIACRSATTEDQRSITTRRSFPEGFVEGVSGSADGSDGVAFAAA